MLVFNDAIAQFQDVGIFFTKYKQQNIMQSSYFQGKTQINFIYSDKLPQFKHTSLPKQLYTYASKTTRYGHSGELVKLRSNLTKYLQKDIQRRHSFYELRDNQKKQNNKSIHKKIIRDYFHKVHRLDKNKLLTKDKINAKAVHEDQQSFSPSQKHKAVIKGMKNNISQLHDKSKKFSTQDKIIAKNNRNETNFYDFIQKSNRKNTNDQLSFSLQLKKSNQSLNLKREISFNPQNLPKNDEITRQKRKKIFTHKLIDRLKCIHLEEVQPWKLKLDQQELNDFV